MSPVLFLAVHLSQTKIQTDKENSNDQTLVLQMIINITLHTMLKTSISRELCLTLTYHHSAKTNKSKYLNFGTYEIDVLKDILEFKGQSRKCYCREIY